MGWQGHRESFNKAFTEKNKSMTSDARLVNKFSSYVLHNNYAHGKFFTQGTKVAMRAIVFADATKRKEYFAKVCVAVSHACDGMTLWCWLRYE